jgi:hypothetical protein
MATRTCNLDARINYATNLIASVPWGIDVMTYDESMPDAWEFLEYFTDEDEPQPAFGLHPEGITPSLPTYVAWFYEQAPDLYES